VSDANVQQQVARLLGDRSSNMTALELGQRFLEPGLFLKNPVDQISLGMALVFGTAGMPHILMRFFTVPTAQAARTSVIWAMGIIGGFYVLTLFLGTAAAMLVGPVKIAAVDAGGNMAAPLLAQYLGGGESSMLGNFFLAFVAAVAFATIVAVVAGLVLASASAMAHDIYVGVIRGEKATPQEQVVAARVSSVIVGILAIAVGILAKGQNVAHLVALAFAVAASSNLPAIALTLYWKPCNTKGIIAGMVMGTATAILLVMISPNMTYPIAVRAAANKVLDGEAATPARLARPAVGGYSFVCELFAMEDCRQSEPARPAEPARAAKPGTREKLVTLTASLNAATEESTQKAIRAELAQVQKLHGKALEDLAKVEGKTTSMMGLEKPYFLLKNPGLVSIPLGFLFVILFSMLTTDPRSEEMWDEMYVRQNTGINAEAASEH
jgi:cation/acetate symporter